jgi:hypothetical protein
MSASEDHGATYQVVVLGELKPAVLAFCVRPPALIKTTGVFRLRVREDQGIAELAAMLQAAGVMILSIRQLSPDEGCTAASLPA